MIIKETYRLFCIENNYFTLGCNEQYKKALDMVDKINKERDKLKKICILDDLAVVTWICSKTDKDTNEIYMELRDLF